MAQYNILASGNQLIIELIVTDGDFAPSIVSLKTPSIKLTTDRIKFFDSAVYNMALLFEQINEIDGVAPTNLEDAADKIIALIANFNGGGAAPYKVYTALLTQSGTDAPVATVLENTLGNITYEYVGLGAYYVKSDELFDNSTFVLIGGINEKGIVYGILDSSTIQIITDSDDALGRTTIEIRVYN